ncbi:N-6 DNA methylase [Yinghuangia sp. ASG 101]|uniref:type I restriction-modification system subunit M/S n=1 Tax=Yinghuangia sp. ASG 101 TaxID=2896848 RepID=UPI001E51A649|nr:type I restriction-modification system subunit M/S [Yinghuangia sp. ASG 101]UGQ09051.1 N-6 DNA methylase [Yinghuangia sp. ASG 101]
MGSYADRIAGAGSKVDYVCMLLALNFLSVSRPESARKLRSFATRQTDSGAILDAVGRETDELLRGLGILAGFREELLKLEPRSPTDLVAVMDRVSDLGGAGFGLILDEYEAQAGLRSNEFFTPRVVAETMAGLAAAAVPEIRMVYDPYARGGELLVAALGQCPGGGAAVLGDSPAAGTLRVAAMNVATHGRSPDLRIVSARPWSNPRRASLVADVVLVNPPFNMRDTALSERVDGTWRFGAPPIGNDNFAWLQYALDSVRPGGVAAVVMPNKAGNSTNAAEQTIRKELVEQGVVECVVALPPQLFSGTPIPVSVWVLRAGGSASDDVLFIDARHLGEKRRARRVLRDSDGDAVVEAYRTRGAEGETGAVAAAARGDGPHVQRVSRAIISGRGHSLNLVDHAEGSTAPRTAGRGRTARTLANASAGGSVTDELGALMHELTRRREDAQEADEAARAALLDAAAVVDAGDDAPLPGGWRRTVLGEECLVKPGPSYTRIPARERTPYGDVPVVFPRHLRDGRIRDITDEKVPLRLARELENFRLRPGDIVCVRSGAFGTPALVDDSQDEWLCSTNLLRIRPMDEPGREPGVDSRYLLALMSSPRIVEWVAERAAATAVPTISGDSLRRLPLLLPPLAEQRRIAALLGALDHQTAQHRELADATSRTRALLAERLMYGHLTL